MLPWLKSQTVSYTVEPDNVEWPSSDRHAQAIGDSAGRLVGCCFAYTYLLTYGLPAQIYPFPRGMTSPVAQLGNLEGFLYANLPNVSDQQIEIDT